MRAETPCELFDIDADLFHAYVLASGLRTADIHSEGTKQVGTREMGDAVVAAITKKTTKG